MPKSKFSVLIYPLAEEDLNDILDYLSELSPAIANSFLEKLALSLEKLGSFPEIHSLGHG
jgi:plasmid stabilization system protein ParE